MDIDNDLVSNIKACRTCGIHYVTPAKNQLMHLFHPCQDRSEINLIRLELLQWNVEVAENDGFPQYVCNTCIHKFEQVFQLRAACIKAQNEFRKFYALPNGNNPNVRIKTEFPEPDEDPPICDFIYVDELSDTEYDGAAPFNYPLIPIKEEFIEAATIPMEDSQQPSNMVESASRIVVQTEPEQVIQSEKVPDIQPTAAVVECTMCHYVCFNEKDLQQHMQSEHGIGDLVCPICGKEFKKSTTARLKFHMKFHTLNKQVKCSFCGFLCNSKQILRQHKRANHRKSNCKVCGKAVLAKKMKSHLRQHELNSKYSCEYCTEAFASETERENHIWEIHANEDNNTLSNSVTNSLTINENSFNMKQAETLCQEPQELIYKFICAQCEQRFISQIDLETHVNREHRVHFATFDPQTTSYVDGARNNKSEMIQNENEVNAQDSFTVFEDYDNNIEIHDPANDSLINNATVVQEDYNSLSTCSPDYVKQNENVQTIIAESASNLLSAGGEFENETNINLSYAESNLNTFACAKCSETFVTIEQLRHHHEQHIAAEQQQEVEISPTKLKFQCDLCVKSFDLKFRLNRHIKKHKQALL